MKVTIDEIRDMVALQLGASEVRPDDDLMRDLAAESADIVNLVAALEDRYGIEIDEEEIADLKTAADLHARVVREMR